MLKLNQRKSWLTFLFTTYGVPALLMIAALPVNHAKACACFRLGVPMLQAAQTTYYCPACAFLNSTPLSMPEAEAAPVTVCVTAACDVALPDPPVSLSPHHSNRAHSPPTA